MVNTEGDRTLLLYDGVAPHIRRLILSQQLRHSASAVIQRNTNQGSIISGFISVVLPVADTHLGNTIEGIGALSNESIVLTLLTCRIQGIDIQHQGGTEGLSAITTEHEIEPLEIHLQPAVEAVCSDFLI